jgi:hypothetical protein
LVFSKIKYPATVVLKKKNSLFSPPFHIWMWDEEKKINGIVAFSEIYLNIVTRCSKPLSVQDQLKLNE